VAYAWRLWMTSVSLQMWESLVCKLGARSSDLRVQVLSC